MFFSNMGFVEGRPIVHFRHRVRGENLMAGEWNAS